MRSNAQECCWMLVRNCQYCYTAMPTPRHGASENLVPYYLPCSHAVPGHGLGQDRHSFLVLLELHCPGIKKFGCTSVDLSAQERSRVHQMRCGKQPIFTSIILKSFLVPRKDLQAKYKQGHSSEKHSQDLMTQRHKQNSSPYYPSDALP